jgi:hypothetical protein
MAILIEPSGQEREVSPPNGKRFTLEQMYQVLGHGCDIVQYIDLRGRKFRGQTGHFQMWLDEEGKLRSPRQPRNEKATELFHSAGGFYSDFVVGPVLITRNMG